RSILRECEARCIEVIPEVQSLSHAYYLCCAHPEIAEREDDPWPDSYCPSNPASYDLLFDVMEEVIALFHPRIVHIGHAGAWSLGVGPRCRDRTGPDLFASDVRKIHEFLAARGIRTLLWGGHFAPEFRRTRTGGDRGTGKTWTIPNTLQAAYDV